MAAAMAEIDRRLDDHVVPRQDLERQPSPLGETRPAQEIVYRHLFRLGPDGRYFPPTTPVVSYGPAGEHVYGPDEFVELERIRRVARALAGIVTEWCG
jgi:hypothetical protein